MCVHIFCVYILIMPINNMNNDQNIDRVYAKMSESFSGQNNNTELSNSEESLKNYFGEINGSDNRNDLTELSCDRIFKTNDIITNGDVVNSNCQSAESEVKFLKEWLILHLDLIQQQNDEILNKEKTILILQQENEMLKERLSSVESRSPFHSSKYFNCHNPTRYIGGNFSEDMTQDSGPNDDDNKEHIHLLNLECETSDNRSLELRNFNTDHDLNKNEKQSNMFMENQDNCSSIKDHKLRNENQLLHKLNQSVVNEAEYSLNSSVLKFNNSNFTIHNLNNTDSGKALRMSIRRKRVCSNSSALSNNDSTIEDKHSGKKIRRRRKCSVKNDQILTSSDQYVTQAGEVAYGLINEEELAIEMAAAAAVTANLEVPRWRVKVYTSCYTMEGTENLDDEVYNKRHSRLENDERRRKRWDVQRIREQRLIEKLKQRQERVGSGSRNGENNEPVHSLWPTVDDIRYLEVCDRLPVSAFGNPMTQFPLSDFSLPWINNPNRLSKKMPTRKSTVRRKPAKK